VLAGVILKQVGRSPSLKTECYQGTDAERRWRRGPLAQRCRGAISGIVKGGDLTFLIFDSGDETRAQQRVNGRMERGGGKVLDKAGQDKGRNSDARARTGRRMSTARYGIGAGLDSRERCLTRRPHVPAAPDHFTVKALSELTREEACSAIQNAWGRGRVCRQEN